MPPWRPNDWKSLTSSQLRHPPAVPQLQMVSYAATFASAQVIASRDLRAQAEWHPEAAVNLRLLGKGVGWAFGIEGVTALCLYAIWFMWHLRP